MVSRSGERERQLSIVSQLPSLFMVKQCTVCWLGRASFLVPAFFWCDLLDFFTFQFTVNLKTFYFNYPLRHFSYLIVLNWTWLFICKVGIHPLIQSFNKREKLLQGENLERRRKGEGDASDECRKWSFEFNAMLSYIYKVCRGFTKCRVVNEWNIYIESHKTGIYKFSNALTTWIKHDDDVFVWFYKK